MVKLVFNPKKGNLTNVATSKSTRSITDVFKSLNPLKNVQNDESIQKTEIEWIPTKDLIGLENTCYILDKWYKESLKDLTKSILILIGPVGCGKTSLVGSYCKENDILLYTVKNTLTKKELLKDIEIFVEYSSTSFFIKDSLKPNKLILIDEYQNGPNDSLSVTDISNLIELRSKNKLCPILVISGDPKGSKISDLKKNNEVYYISDIPKNLIQTWASNLFPNFEKKQITELINKCKSDKRLLLNSLGYLKNNNSQDINKYIESFYKDSDSNIYEFTEKLFDSTEPMSYSDIEKVYDTDGFLVSLMVQENYLDYNSDMDSIAKAADSISYAETVFSDTFESNRNFLPDIHLLNGLVIPRFYGKYPCKINKCQLRTSCVSNRYNIYLNNQKTFKRLNKFSPIDILYLKKFVNQELVKKKVLTQHQLAFLKGILNSFEENPIENLELIYKHFSEFKDIPPKTKNFTIKFKEKLRTLL
jgi:GTPase SAR1 family protein